LLVKPSECYHFLFIGSGEDRRAAESIIAAGNRLPGATFAGWISHHRVPSYLDACDVLVSPQVESGDGSRFFGSPTKLFEYMAMARPVVASRIGQMSELIVDGQNGVLVDPGDPPALAKAIEALAGDDQKRERIGIAARATVIERYTWRHNVERAFDAIERLL
jgi:glycosyltransferase involved in cell wall biosynthesis